MISLKYCFIVVIASICANSETSSTSETGTQLGSIQNGNFLNLFFANRSVKLRVSTLTNRNESYSPIVVVVNTPQVQVEAIFSFEGDLENCQILSNQPSGSGKDFSANFLLNIAQIEHALYGEEKIVNFTTFINLTSSEFHPDVAAITDYLPKPLQFLSELDLVEVSDIIELDCFRFMTDMELQYDKTMNKMKRDRNSKKIKKLSQQRKKMIQKISHRPNRKNYLALDAGLNDEQIWPNTKWCGNEYLSVNIEDLDANMQGLEICCQEHNVCPVYIKGFSTKYNYENWSPFTINDCKCDEKYRTCLHQQSQNATSVSGAFLLAEYLFNLTNPLCSRVTLRTVCLAQSWWGSCIREECHVTAVPRTSEHRFGG